MGRDKKNEAREHFAKMSRHLMMTPAFRALNSHAKALYPFLKLEWHGPSANNNGQLMLSYRQAAALLSVSIETAGKAFRDLQAKGFVIVRIIATPGLTGRASGHQYQLTEVPMPGEPTASRNFTKWRADQEFRVEKSISNNPTGNNGKNKNRT